MLTAILPLPSSVTASPTLIPVVSESPETTAVALLNEAANGPVTVWVIVGVEVVVIFVTFPARTSTESPRANALSGIVCVNVTVCDVLNVTA